jgi:hypothetical protein
VRDLRLKETPGGADIHRVKFLGATTFGLGGLLLGGPGVAIAAIALLPLLIGSVHLLNPWRPGFPLVSRSTGVAATHRLNLQRPSIRH